MAEVYKQFSYAVLFMDFYPKGGVLQYHPDRVAESQRSSTLFLRRRNLIKKTVVGCFYVYKTEYAGAVPPIGERYVITILLVVAKSRLQRIMLVVVRN